MKVFKCPNCARTQETKSDVLISVCPCGYDMELFTYSKNRHRGMEFKSFWFNRGEFAKLISAFDCNESSMVMDVLFDMKMRGDLK